MIRKLFKIHGGQKGITGLETAIILIAFVVVAAVFAYTVLSAGLFATQKSQEAVYSGLQEARSTIELRGGVIATAGTTGSSGTIKQVSFIISSVLGGEAIDFTAPTADGSNTGLAASSSSTMRTSRRGSTIRARVRPRPMAAMPATTKANMPTCVTTSKTSSIMGAPSVSFQPMLLGIGVANVVHAVGV